MPTRNLVALVVSVVVVLALALWFSQSPDTREGTEVRTPPQTPNLSPPLQSLREKESQRAEEIPPQPAARQETRAHTPPAKPPTQEAVALAPQIIDAAAKGDLERVKTILEDSRKTPQMWRYTEPKPAANWHAPDFDDSAWKEGKGGFGREKTPGAVIGTPWLSDDIWIRRTFDVKDVGADNVFLCIHHDEDAEVYVNGKLIATFAQYTQDYILSDVTEKIRGVLKPGRNLIAIHCHQTVGGQYIDAGLNSVRVISSP
jgi:hypothetical protein